MKVMPMPLAIAAALSIASEIFEDIQLNLTSFPTGALIFRTSTGFPGGHGFSSAENRKGGAGGDGLEIAGFERLQHWIDEHRNIWARRLDALGELLDEDEAPGIDKTP